MVKQSSSQSEKQSTNSPWVACLQPRILKHCEGVRACWERVLEPLHQYLGTYSKYNTLLARSNADFVTSLQAREDLTLSDMKAEMASAQAELEAIAESVPTKVCDLVLPGTHHCILS